MLLYNYRKAHGLENHMKQAAIAPTAPETDGHFFGCETPTARALPHHFWDLQSRSIVETQASFLLVLSFLIDIRLSVF